MAPAICGASGGACVCEAEGSPLYRMRPGLIFYLASEPLRGTSLLRPPDSRLVASLLASPAA